MPTIPSSATVPRIAGVFLGRMPSKLTNGIAHTRHTVIHDMNAHGK